MRCIEILPQDFTVSVLEKEEHAWKEGQMQEITKE